MRLPLILILLLAPGTVYAGSSHPSYRAPMAPLNVLAAARGLARYKGDRRQPTGDRREAANAFVRAQGAPPAADGSPMSPSAASAASPAPSAAATPPPASPAGPDSPPAPPAAPSPGSAPPSSPPPAPAPGAAPPLIGPPPPLMLSSSHAVVPVGETRGVTVMGAPKPPDLTTTPAEIVTVTRTPGPDPGTWRLTLAGLVPGETAVRVSIDDRSQTLSVRVMKYAGQVRPAAVEITGQPAPVEFVLRAARAAVEEAAKREPDAVVAIASPSRMPPELPAGQAAALSFSVSITGPNLLPVKAVATVTVRNRDLDARDVGVLLYSNDPERVARAGILFAAELAVDGPARLLYHHQNASDEPLRARLELVNPTDQPVDVQVIDGAAGPTRDAVEAGHRAAARYVRSALQDLGTIVRVPARSEQAVALQRMPPGTTVSGLFGLRSLGVGLFVRVVAEPDAAPVVALRPAEKPDRLSEQVYPSPRRPLSARYVVGKNWAFLNLGSDPVVARGSRRKLAGNYGVSYEMTLDLSNPTDQPRSVVLTLSPDAGDARGVFVIDGAVVEAPEVSPPVEADLATFHLQPGERRVVRVQTLPIGGSSYPARLVIRPIDPLRTAQTVVGK